VSGGESLDSHVLELPVFKRIEAEAVEDGIPAPSCRVIRRRSLSGFRPSISGSWKRSVSKAGTRLPYRMIDIRVPRGRWVLTVNHADAEMAFLLEIPPEHPVVTVTRWILDQHDKLI